MGGEPSKLSGITWGGRGSGPGRITWGGVTLPDPSPQLAAAANALVRTGGGVS